MSNSCRGFQMNDHWCPMQGKTILAAVIHALHERRTRLSPTQQRRTSGAKRRPSPPFVLSYAASTQLLYLRSLLERHNPPSLEGSIEDTAVYNPAFSGHKVLEYYMIGRVVQNDLFEVRHHSWKIWRKVLGNRPIGCKEPLRMSE